ncbi:enoyl-ACP reductase FabI [Spongiimicrobium sp. 2-473A-2-J]|uniref:enoyl-ACP reductase FabI n=1 Tax=Eudoraea algarum TaxID=3417568 RepID=UPI003D35FAA8
MIKHSSSSNEWALIIGGSSGLGLATAKKLAGEGFNIIIVHRDKKSDLQSIESDFKEITLIGVAFQSYNMDALHPEKRTRLIQQIKGVLGPVGKVKVLVHSIAKGNLKPMRSATDRVLGNADFHLTLDAMAINLYDWAQLLIREDLFASDARIVAFTSEGSVRAWPNYGAVSAAKAALEAIIRNMALEFAPLGIRANGIQAGITETKSFKQIPGHEALRKHALERNPHGRLTRPEDVANAAYLLCTEEAQWITGTIITVDGGESLQ